MGTVNSISAETVDCIGSMKFLATLLTKKALMLSLKPCMQEEEPEIDTEDCIEKYRNLAAKLIGFFLNFNPDEYVVFLLLICQNKTYLPCQIYHYKSTPIQMY